MLISVLPGGCHLQAYTWVTKIMTASHFTFYAFGTDSALPFIRFWKLHFTFYKKNMFHFTFYKHTYQVIMDVT